MFTLGGLAARERRVRKSEQLYATAEADPSHDVPPEMKDLQKIAVDFSQIPLQPPKPSLTMMRNGNYVTEKATVLTVLCHDRLQNRVSISMENKSLFHVEGARWGTSWSWRRKVFDDMTGAHMFDFRHESVSLKNGWIVHNAENEKLCSLVHKRFFTKTHSGIVATLHTQAGQDINVDMQPRDGLAAASTVNAGDQSIACIYKVAMETNLMGYDNDRSLYKIHVAAGVDLSFIVVMAMCRAEMGAVWAQ